MDAKKLLDDLTQANAVLGAAVPFVTTAVSAYTILYGIWARTNPGKTEDDYLAYLRTAAQATIDDTAAYLTAQGYVQDPTTLAWSKKA